MTRDTTFTMEQRGPVCTLRLDHPANRNALTRRVVEDGLHLLTTMPESVTVVVLHGNDEVFCSGADLGGAPTGAPTDGSDSEPALLYRLLRMLGEGPYVSVASVRGEAIAGGVGLAAASDVVVAAPGSRFRLPELLFGLHPACVLPFLARRCGAQQAHYLATTTMEIDAEEAHRRHLVDLLDPGDGSALTKLVRRLRCLPPDGIRRYKEYRARLDTLVPASEAAAVQANLEAFGDPTTRERIRRWVEGGVMPWE